MHLATYAERAADLVNADLDPPGAVAAYLSDRGQIADQVTDKDGRRLRRFQRAVRPVFDQEARDADVIGLLNSLLDKHRVAPYIAGHDADSWHLHVSTKTSSVADLLIAETLMALARLACDLGPERFGECRADRCDAVYVDTSPNRSRRYCSERCSSRANVAAYRARQKALSGG